jgi:hypothetical protein
MTIFATIQITNSTWEKMLHYLPEYFYEFWVLLHYLYCNKMNTPCNKAIMSQYQHYITMSMCFIAIHVLYSNKKDT